MLYGRSTEQAKIARMIEVARDHNESGVLVLTGEPGIGKSALLGWAAARLDDITVVRVLGNEAETDLAYAGLHQLLWPLRDKLDGLPQRQADALASVINNTGGGDRFLIGLGILTLLADLAPVLCLVDDAHWLDRASAEALMFAARRLSAEGVAMLFATRDEGFSAPDLDEVRLARLSERDSRALLADSGASQMRDQVIHQAQGNPLALLAFTGSDGGTSALPLPDRVTASFARQIGELTSAARLMLLIVASEGRGHLPTTLEAARAMGVGTPDLVPAEEARLVEVTDEDIRLRHPLLRAAVLHAAPLDLRIRVHRALADAADDPYCRARHLAAAATGPDEDVASLLEAEAVQARSGGGDAAAASLSRRAAGLSPAPADRTRRLADAAEDAHRAGLIELAETLVTDSGDLVRLAPVRAAIEFERRDPGSAARILLEHGVDLRTAALYAWFAGDAAAVKEANGLLSGADPLVDGMSRLVDDDFGAGLPLLAGFVNEASADAVPAIHAAMLLGDDEALIRLATAEADRRRHEGRAGDLPAILQQLGQAQLRSGRRRDAEATLAEAIEIARDTGQERRIGRLETSLAWVAAIAGDEERLRRLTRELPDAGGVPAECGQSLIDLVRGHHEAALERLERAGRGPGRYTAILVFSLPDQVEAAARLGAPDRAKAPLERFRAWAEASAQPWARAVALRCRALVNEDGDMFESAIRLHERGGRPFERARTELLYSEWLRRSRRRADARSPLRSAMETFDRLHATPWADLSRAELRATGETHTAVTPDLIDRLTPQELQVVRLAADGISSREIAARLFLSPRTVEYHLYKAYPKLGVSSRRELPGLGI